MWRGGGEARLCKKRIHFRTINGKDSLFIFRLLEWVSDVVQTKMAGKSEREGATTKNKKKEKKKNPCRCYTRLNKKRNKIVGIRGGQRIHGILLSRGYRLDGERRPSSDGGLRIDWVKAAPSAAHRILFIGVRSNSDTDRSFKKIEKKKNGKNTHRSTIKYHRRYASRYRTIDIIGQSVPYI